MEAPKELKEGLDFLIAFINCMGRSMKDGRVDLTDALNFLPVLMKAPAAFNDVNKIPTELNELQPEVKGWILTYVRAQVDIPNDKVELYVEMAIEVLLQLGTMISGFKKS